MSKRKIIMVKVVGKEYPTIKVGKVQRFIEDPLIRGLVDLKIIDLNYLHELFVCKKICSRRRYMEFKMSLGYSVAGFASLFPYAKIENPVWEKRSKEK